MVTKEDLKKLLARIGFEYEKTPEGKFKLIDLQGGNLGDIENEEFDTVEQVIDRLDIYWADDLLLKSEAPKGYFDTCEDALRHAFMYGGDPSDIWALSKIMLLDLHEAMDKFCIKDIGLFYKDSRAHIDALYEANQLPRLANGNYVVYLEEPEGWHEVPPQDLANGEQTELGHVDYIRKKLAETCPDKKLPAINGFLFFKGKDPAAHSADDYEIHEFNSETAYGEPQMWIYLLDKTSIEVTHEEEGLNPSEQYFSVRHHCSEEDFENDTYRGTCGVIRETSGDLEVVRDELKRLINLDRLKAMGMA